MPLPQIYPLEGYAEVAGVEIGENPDDDNCGLLVAHDAGPLTELE